MRIKNKPLKSSTKLPEKELEIKEKLKKWIEKLIKLSLAAGKGEIVVTKLCMLLNGGISPGQFVREIEQMYGVKCQEHLERFLINCIPLIANDLRVGRFMIQGVKCGNNIENVFLPFAFFENPPGVNPANFPYYTYVNMPVLAVSCKLLYVRR